MAFSSDFYLKVLQHLRLKISDADTIKAALAEAETDLDLEAAVTTTVADLDTVCQALINEQSSPNSALIRADVLEWSEGERSTGMMSRKRDLQQQLAPL